MNLHLQNKSTAAALTRFATELTLERWSTLAGSLYMGLDSSPIPGSVLGGRNHARPFCANQEGHL